MSIRLVLISLVCLLWSATAQAAQSGGGSPGGTNYTCDGSVCSCNGTYQDCKSMEKECIDGAILCTNRCQCAMKVPPARPQGGQTKPRPGTPARIPPTAPVKQQ